MVNVTFLKWLFQLIGKMVKTNDYLWVTITQKNIVTTDSNYNHFFLVVVTGPFLQCMGSRDVRF